ncbi:MAG: potassium transporter TrkA [Elusimicrobia bacterium HGW-Elusimicrobia-2]|nr:MAG: potassium transporter TrkA [Elusimicrobia bacterium HGW-Elusimicrobia-2]
MRQIAIIGLGSFGNALAKALASSGVEVIAIDRDKDRIEELKEYVTLAVACDATDEKTLKNIGLGDVDLACVAIGEDVEACLLTSILLKKLGVPAIFSRAVTPMQKEILKAIGVTRIIEIENEMGKEIANAIIAPRILKRVSLGENHSMAEIKVPPSFVGKRISELNLRQKNRINIVAIKRNVPDIDKATGSKTTKEEINTVPDPDTYFDENDIIIVAGTDKDIKNI